MKKATEMSDQDLDDLFATARAQAPAENAALLARIYADSLRVQPQPMPVAQRAAVGNPGWWATMFTALGGKRGLAGLGTAAIAGVMLGFVQPTSVLALTEAFFVASTVDEVDLMPGIDAILTEG